MTEARGHDRSSLHRGTTRSKGVGFAVAHQPTTGRACIQGHHVAPDHAHFVKADHTPIPEQPAGINHEGQNSAAVVVEQQVHNAAGSLPFGRDHGGAQDLGSRLISPPRAAFGTGCAPASSERNALAPRRPLSRSYPYDSFTASRADIKSAGVKRQTTEHDLNPLNGLQSDEVSR
jgi:hypothetical protein